MAELFYKEWHPKPESRQMVALAAQIIEDYQAEGYTLTLRQLYYQFVARDLIENSERSYKNLGTLITKARMAGMISWEAIEDRNREHHTFYYEENDARLVRGLPGLLSFDRWQRQPCYVEVWVEKEALGNVVSRACEPLKVPYMSCKGYLSASEAWRAGQRFAEQLEHGKECILIHLGDHDPSGIDMTRDNRERLDLFTRQTGGVKVQRIALNMDQVQRYDPPPNPAKITDSRAKEYIRRYGYTSWELDALEPQVMADMITKEVERHIDWDAWHEVGQQQDEAKATLRKLGDNWAEIKANYL